VRSGKPCVAGTRITVTDVLEYLASGMDEATILADFPDLFHEHIQAVLAFVAERERRLSALPAVSCFYSRQTSRGSYARGFHGSRPLRCHRMNRSSLCEDHATGFDWLSYPRMLGVVQCKLLLSANGGW